MTIRHSRPWKTARAYFGAASLAMAFLATAPSKADKLPDTQLAASLDIDAPSRPMIGWVTFCREQPVECAPEALTEMKAPLTAANWLELKAINSLVNRSIEPIADDEHYGIYQMGIRNWWTYPDDGKGNCNDYVLLKRKLLIEAGWPKSALSMTVVRTPAGEGHLVLMARTDRGDIILDNLRDNILVWNQTEYDFIKRQSNENHNAWVSFRAGGGAPIQTSSGAKLPRLNSH